MLIALLTLMLLGGDSYDLTEFIAEGQSNMAVAVEDPERRQTALDILVEICLLYTSPSPRDYAASRMPSSA